ncbi:NAD(P)-dependent oxidoreductase [Roseomonas genomospecies 6]|uniref:NAD(P)-dependent oxidoreductase n=1 Tax=Roseomonas genomospecies 6 TaxID=214106 RepID=A0A9W7KPU3_9PROT|nr:NAD(P)-dependent oxidoreductase [Roseomonas genomospecies 6]KAA0676210.1 NAD(P)-dependent oxidoreductase [Roseomonas genomospecies 6]
MPERILVTGAGGFLGRAVLRLARTHWPSAEVVAVGHRTLPAGGPAIAVDLTAPEAQVTLSGRWDLIVHVAANIPTGAGAGRLAGLRDNLRMAETLLAVCERAPPKRLVMASSISVYPMGAAPVLHEGLAPCPDTPYGVGKLAAEHVLGVVRSFGTRVAILRLSSLYGPGQSAMSVLRLFLDRALAGSPLRLFGDGGRTQDFLHVEDAARGLVAAAGADGVFNLGSGEATSMAELARLITALPACRGSAIEFTATPDPSPSVRLDIGRAWAAFGYRPHIALTSGLEDYCHALLQRL